MNERERKLVYFLRPFGERGPVKIGCSMYPKDRLLTMQAWSPVKLELAAQCAGCNAHERLLHACFIGNRVHGEWFAWSSDLENTIEHVRAHGELPAQFQNTPKSAEEWRAFRAIRVGSMSRGSAFMVDRSESGAA